MDIDKTKRSNNIDDKVDVVPIAEMEKRLIFSAFKETLNHKTKAAELLGITVRTLRNKLHQFELEEN